MSESTPKGPFTLVTVNTDPERASRIIGRTTEILKDRFIIRHLANCQEIAKVHAKVSEHRPYMLVCASMWTPEQSALAVEIAKKARPEVRTYVLPQGLGKRIDEDEFVEYMCEALSKVLSETV